MECFKEEEKYTNIKLYSLLSDNTDKQLNCIKDLISNEYAKNIYFCRFKSDTMNSYEIGVIMQNENNIEIYKTNLNSDRKQRQKEVEELLELVENLNQFDEKKFMILSNQKYDFSEFKNAFFCINFDSILENKSNRIDNIDSLKEFLCPYIK